MDPIIWAALIAVGGAVVTAVSALHAKRLENRYAVDAQFRGSKEQLYLEFTETLDKVFDGKMSDGRLLDEIKNFKRKLILWGSVKTIRRFNAFATISMGSDKTTKWLLDSTRAYGDFLLAMRKDLDLPCKGLDRKEFGARHVLRNPELLLRLGEESPDMSLDELAKIEAKLDRVNRRG